MITSGLPTVTRTSAPDFETTAVLLAGSYDTVAPICSNIERSGIRIVPPRTSAAKTRPCLSTSGREYTWRSLYRIGICPEGGEPKFAGGVVVCATGVADVAASAADVPKNTTATAVRQTRAIEDDTLKQAP